MKHSLTCFTALLLAPLAALRAADKSLGDFRQLVRMETWAEKWTDASGKLETRSVTAEVWNVAMQAPLDAQGALHIPARERPYYLDGPIVLKSGQRLTADPKAEIRLKPGCNTCMVRNERVARLNDRPVPTDLPLDAEIHIEGGTWSQGPHSGWGGGLFGGGRARRSPTPDELRSQAVHALSTRITSLFWFNLSLKSLLRFPDTWEPIQRIGREIRMLEPFYLAGEAYRLERRTRSDGSPDWDLASIAAPDAAVLFALDTAYAPDPQEHVFRFSEPREASFSFDLPPWLRKPRDLFRVDADGVREVNWRIAGQGVVIDDRCSRDAIYVATTSQQMRGDIEERRTAALAREEAFPADLMALENLKK